MASMDAPQNTAEADIVVGRTDGFRQGYVEGWAWRPNRPHDPVVVQLLVDGAIVAEATACMPRPDLVTASIGQGNYAFAIPFTIEPDFPPVLHITVRAKDGDVLPGGDFNLETSEEARLELARRRSLGYLESVFGPFTAVEPPPPRVTPPPEAPILNFVLYSALGSTATSSTLGMPDYSYAFVMRGYRELLRRLGVVHVVRDPAEAEAIHAACQARGEACLLFSFAPPQSTRLGLRCPTIPVIAWEFSSIPTGGWSDDARQDWRLVLRETGRAITISEYAARVIRAGMGADYPVISIPTPVWDRLAGLRARLQDPATPRPGGPVTLCLDGFVWDSRTAKLALTSRAPPLPAVKARRPAQALPMRGALLALARASAAEAEAAAAAEAARRHQAQAAAEAAAETSRVAAAEAARAAAEAAARLPPPRKTPRQRVGVTIWFARQWYREAVRDALPGPVRGMFSVAGRVAVALRRPAAAQEAPPPAMLAVAAPALPQAEPPIAAPHNEPAVQTPSPTPPDVEPPVNVRYFPVGEVMPNPPPPSLPRFLPAADEPPFPEPDLAVFHPDPYPDPAGADEALAEAQLSGIIFTAVLAPKDGRKNWQDIVTAFADAFRDEPEATLVLKMVGADPAYWWWEFNTIVRALPAFRGRILVLSGYLDDAEYQRLIAATHFVVNASLAEGQCLPLVEFMSAHRPAIAPLHTAMLDYITPRNAIIVDSAAEFCSWPHDPRNHLITTRHRIKWPSLRDAYREAFQIATADRARWAAMAENAADSVRGYCADAALAPALAAFLGLGDEVLERAGWPAKPRQAMEPGA